MWNYYYDFDREIQLADWKIREKRADGSLRIVCEAELEKEAEDVSITLTTNGNPRPVQVNGKVKIQLKPTDKTQKIWTAEIEVKSISLKKSCKRHKLFMKMDVLGGDLDEPVWVGLPYGIAP